MVSPRVPCPCRACDEPVPVRTPRETMSTVHKLTAVVMVIVAAVLAVFTSSQTLVPTTTRVPVTSKPLLAVDLSATPSGWVPVAYGDAQVSVPANFKVFYLDTQCSSNVRPGTVLVGESRPALTCSRSPVQPGGTLVHLHPLTRNPASWTHEKPTLVNGLSFYLGPGMDPLLAGYGLEYQANDYIVPSLGIEVAGVGLMTKRVIDTLARSPRAWCSLPVQSQQSRHPGSP